MNNRATTLLATTIVGLGLIIGLTGCATTKSKPFEYKEWHNVQINEYGEKCTYTQPQKSEFSQKFEDGVSAFVGGTLGVVLGTEEKCNTLAQWREINRQASAMIGLVNSIQSIRSTQGSFSSFNAPSFNLNSTPLPLSSGSSSYNSNLPSLNPAYNSNSPSWKWINSSPPSLNPGKSSWNSLSPSGYKSEYGNTYQYDLSKPLDRIKYKTDLDAQLRDRITPNPYKDIETNILQKGGGIYPTNNSLTWEPVR